MKLSIITAVYNNKNTIKDAIDSVLSQTYENIEYIVVDGGSSDGTVDILQSYGDKISKLISEPDKGIYDALNKGIESASGDVIGFLHSDDVYSNSSLLSKVAYLFGEHDGVYGDLVYTPKDDTEKIFRHWRAGEFHANKLAWGWMPPHPTLFLKREVYKKHGGFDLDFKIAADYDFMLRVLHTGIKTGYIPEVLYKMRLGGKSNKSLKNIIQKSREDYIAIQKNGVGGMGTLAAKNLRKIGQFLG